MTKTELIELVRIYENFLKLARNKLIEISQEIEDEQEFDLGVGIQEFATCDRNLLTLKTLVGREKYSEALELIEAIRNGQEDLISLMNYKKYELMDSGDNVLLVRAIDTVIDKLKVMPLQIEAKLKELT
jgi:hypothetical protein